MAADGTVPDWFFTDAFAGVGGASLGIKMATGVDVGVAVNHWDVAVAMHGMNHKLTTHHRKDVYEVDPYLACGGRSPDLAWFSPTCTEFSRAKGSKPLDNKLRALPWIVNEWARRVRMNIFVMENVPEIEQWGPVGDDNKLIPARKGEIFKAWVQDLKQLGYEVEWRRLRAHHYGAPTSRERLFVVGRRDGKPIRWPTPSHGAPGNLQGLPSYQTAASCIDWSIPSLSIFATREEARAFAKKYKCGCPRRPLAPKTLARIAKGLVKFVIECPRPFIVPLTHGGDSRVHDSRDPFRTITGAHRGELALATPYITKFQQNSLGQELGDPLHNAMAGAQRFGVVSPLLVQTGYGERKANSYGRFKGQDVRVLDIQQPLGTIVGGGQRHGLASVILEKAGVRLADAAWVARNFTDRDGGWAGGEAVDGALSTITARDHHSVVTASLVELKGDGADACRGGLPVDEPMGTVLGGGNHWYEVRALLAKYYGEGVAADVAEPLDTVTAKGRFGLAPVVVALDGDSYVIVDVGFRMLTPRELARAQGFPDWREELTLAWCAPVESAAILSSQPPSSGSTSAPSASSKRAVVHARIDFGASVLELRSPEKCFTRAAAAAAVDSVSFPLPTQLAAFALNTAGTQADAKAATSPANASASTPHASGTTCVDASAGVTRFASVAGVPLLLELQQCTTSQGGRCSPLSVSNRATLCSFVTDAIASCIREATLPLSFDVCLTLEYAYALEVGPDGERLTTEDQVRLVGNSVPPQLAAAVVRANLLGVGCEELRRAA